MLKRAGLYFDGVSAQPQKVEVWREGDQLLAHFLTTEIEILNRPLATVKIEHESSDPYHPKGLRIFTGSDDAHILTDQVYSEFIASAQTRTPQKKSLTKSFVFYAALVPIAWLLISNTAQWLSRTIAMRIPSSIEKKIGDEIIPYLKLAEVPTDALLKEKLLNRLNSAHGSNQMIEVHITKDSQLNAFALPGGHVIVTCAMLRFLKNGEELAAILSHEYQHVLQKHHMTHLVRFLFFSSIWHAVIGDFSGLVVADPVTLNLLATMKFSRTDETEADLKGRELLIKAGINPSGFSTTFDRLANEESSGSEFFSYFSSHPTHQSRIKLEEITPEVQNPILTREEFRSIQAQCDSK